MRVFALIGIFLLCASSSAAKILKKDHVEVRVVSSQPELSSTSKIGVHFKIEPHWHIYWKNPGDSGTAPEFELSGGEIKKVSWPYPTRFPVGDLTNFGYETEVVFPLEIMPYESQMILRLDWLVCKVECIPGSGKFKLSGDLSPDSDGLLKKFDDLVPKTATNWSFEFVEKSESAVVFDMGSNNEIAQIERVFVYPENASNFKTELPTVEPMDEKLRVRVPISVNADFTEPKESFTFVIHKLDKTIQHFTHDLEVKSKPVSWLWGMFLAFCGGLILNLMPCVFPVLFLKAFGFLKEPNSVAIRKSSWQYSLGVVLSFVFIGSILTALRFSGEAIGWGFQLQQPWLVYLLALLFFAMALNFFGFFEIGDGLVAQTSRFQSSRFFSSSFGTGVLAVIVASPCTAPFMGSALGLTLILPAFQSILIFAALGMGMAVPMLLLAHVPKLVEKLPRSGNWMILVKQFMAFPLLATCLWLLWVLSHQKGPEAVLIALGSFVFFTFGIWLLNLKPRMFFRVCAVLFIVAAPASYVYIAEKFLNATSTKLTSNWAAFDEAVISEKRKTQPVFIDFTASWCITCQVNKRTVLDTQEIQDFFKANNVFLVRADWTNQDPVITQALARHGRNSVPFYLFYNKLDQQILPEILTKDLVKGLVLKEK